MRKRLFGTPRNYNLPNTKVGAQEAERRAIAAELSPTGPPRERKEVPTLEEFSKLYLDVAAADNKPSTLDTKRQIMRQHVLPHLGRARLDAVRYAEIQDLKLRLLGGGLGPKSVNNVLTVLRRMLEIARKREIVTAVPEVEWLKAPKPEFDFLTFDEAERLVDGARDEWRVMVLVALRTGLRQGELIGLRWEDVDLVAGRLMVRQNVVRGHVGTPKSGKSREVPLSGEALAALKAHRHLRGDLVFCDLGGRVLTKGETKWPLWSACKRAGLRRIGWHVLRHSFASHLVMRGAPLKAVQELLGHATIQMTMRYAHLAPEVARDAVGLLDGRGAGAPESGAPVASSWHHGPRLGLSS
jgi:integrase